MLLKPDPGCLLLRVVEWKEPMVGIRKTPHRTVAAV